ncbi:MAG: SDR family NAD(P)-dependent oxidoreductase [Schleiferiaceae bacterium]|nr:SDR family NAD(P)-dependent oxidoreductase [Schleiferiaceae bacterium]MDP4958625.1 SDR family NAD(P)-dependent oxidoreductase [Schleiferiaceae bacterium]
MRNILLTGGGGGIAKAIAPLLAAEPFRLLLTTREGNALESFCKENNIQAEVFSADLTLQEDVEALFDWAKTFGGVDVLINNAGISHAAASWKLSAEEMHRLMEVNFYSAVRCTQLALQGMRLKGYGRIISVSSVVAHKPAFGTSAYTASKSALEGFMRGVALDVSTQGITANTIAYGYMNAGMLNDVPQPILDEIRKGIPQDHFGRPEQIVAALKYLINSEYTTGQTLHINGGQWMP